MGTPYLITPPEAEVVTAEEVRTMLGLGSADPSDEFLEMLIGAVVGTLDAERGWLGRALADQTWEYRLDGFPLDGSAIVLPYPPHAEIESIKYDDAGGVEQTLVEGTDYQIIGLGGHNRASLKPMADGGWPAASGVESARVRFVCGYAEDSLPREIKAAVALGVRHLMTTGTKDLTLARAEVPGVLVRQYVVSDAAAKAIEAAIGSLLGTFRVVG